MEPRQHLVREQLKLSRHSSMPWWLLQMRFCRWSKASDAMTRSAARPMSPCSRPHCSRPKPDSGHWTKICRYWRLAWAWHMSPQSPRRPRESAQGNSTLSFATLNRHRLNMPPPDAKSAGWGCRGGIVVGMARRSSIRSSLSADLVDGAQWCQDFACSCRGFVPQPSSTGLSNYSHRSQRGF